MGLAKSPFRGFQSHPMRVHTDNDHHLYNRDGRISSCPSAHGSRHSAEPTRVFLTRHFSETSQTNKAKFDSDSVACYYASVFGTRVPSVEEGPPKVPVHSVRQKRQARFVDSGWRPSWNEVLGESIEVANLGLVLIGNASPGIPGALVNP